MDIVEGDAEQSHIYQRKAPFCQNPFIDFESRFTLSFKTTPPLNQIPFSIYFRVRRTVMEKNQK